MFIATLQSLKRGMFRYLLFASLIYALHAHSLENTSAKDDVRLAREPRADLNSGSDDALEGRRRCATSTQFVINPVSFQEELHAHTTPAAGT